jgi:hypothetical protein
MPEVNMDTLHVVFRLDPEHTFLLDTGYKEYKKLYPGVYQNFEKDIYTFLKNAEHLVLKYKRLFLFFPEKWRSKDIISGFNKFS